ncbi:efflux RND transporter periplasmic adaptor subunit [Candidatus Neomarinimicrobiota bacterium]
MKSTSILMLTVTTALLLAGCGKKAANDDTATYTRQASSVRAYEVVRKEISRNLAYSGILVPLREARILPDMPGKVQSMLVDIGDVVRKEQKLAVMDNTTLKYQLDQAKAGLAVAKASEADAEKNWQRTQNLYSEQAISQQQYEKVRLGYQAAGAQLQQAQATANLLNHQYEQTTLRAPIDGVITQRGYEEEDLVNPAMAREPVYTVMDVSNLKVEIQIPMNEIVLIKKGQVAQLRVPTEADRVFPGRVTIVNIAAEAGSKTFYVETLFENAKGLLNPGIFGEVSVEVEKRMGSLVVPRSALIDGNTVFVIRDDTAYQTPIVLGLMTPDLIEVVSGLREGDIVIVEGSYTLADSSKVRIETGEL